MHIVFHNLTNSILIVEPFASGQHVLFPSTQTGVDVPRGAESVSISRCKDTLNTDVSERLTVRVKTAGSWNAVSLPATCPWVWYCLKLSKKRHALLILPRRDASCFLSSVPDSVPLSALLLPGTHDTMAFYGWPLAQCQSSTTPLAVQLRSGIRMLDIRLSLIDGRLIAYHDVYPQKAPFQDILAAMHAFLTAPATRREALVVSIKQEDFRTTPAPVFSAAVRAEIENGPGGAAMWFLQNRVPHLGEVRGRVVLFSRFGGDGAEWEHGLEGMGIHPTTWPDSEKEGFTWNCKNTLVRTHDWYRVPTFLSIPEKVDLATRILLPPPPASGPPTPVLSLTYFSASTFPFAAPQTVARGFGWPRAGLGVEGVNSRVVRWLLSLLAGEARYHHAPGAGPRDLAQPGPSPGSEEQDEDDEEKTMRGDADVEVPRVRGWAMIDFFRDPQDALVPLLIDLNFRARRAGEEGWA